MCLRDNSAPGEGLYSRGRPREPHSRNERLIELPHWTGERARRASIDSPEAVASSGPLRVPPEVRAPSMALGNQLGRVGGSGEAYWGSFWSTAGSK